MKKNLRSSLLFVFFILAVIILSFGTFWIGKNATKRESAKIEDCQSEGTNHITTIEDDKITPESINTKICDRLTIINKDDKLRLIAFGVHDAHIYYNGVTEKTLKKDQELTITLNQGGTYIIHDHLQEETQAQFRVE
jgi:hypothetical protein